MAAPLDPERYSLSTEWLTNLYHREIAPDLFDNARPQDTPTAILLGGQPGAGKTPMQHQAVTEFANQGGLVMIIGDDLRAELPHYTALQRADDKTAAFFTDRDSGRLVEMALADAARRRVNVLVEGTMRSPDVVAKTLTQFREAGYHTDARALAVHSELSELGILQRYVAQKESRGIGRMTTPQAHKAGFDGMLATLDQIQDERIADRLTIYRRGGEILHQFDLSAPERDDAPRARGIVEQERARSFTHEEEIYLRSEMKRLQPALERFGVARSDEPQKIYSRAMPITRSSTMDDDHEDRDITLDIKAPTEPEKSPRWIVQEVTNKGVGPSFREVLRTDSAMEAYERLRFGGKGAIYDAASEKGDKVAEYTAGGPELVSAVFAEALGSDRLRLEQRPDASREANKIEAKPVGETDEKALAKPAPGFEPGEPDGEERERKAKRRDAGLFVSNPAEIDQTMGGMRADVEKRLGHGIVRMAPAKSEGEYRGPIVAADTTHLYQAVGREQNSVIVHDRNRVGEMVGGLADRDKRNDLVGRNVQMHYHGGQTKAYPFDPAKQVEKWKDENRFATVSRLRETTAAAFDRRLGKEGAQREFVGKLLDESINKVLAKDKTVEAARTVTERQVQEMYDGAVDRIARSLAQAQLLKDTLREGVRKSYESVREPDTERNRTRDRDLPREPTLSR